MGEIKKLGRQKNGLKNITTTQSRDTIEDTKQRHKVMRCFKSLESTDVFLDLRENGLQLYQRR